MKTIRNNISDIEREFHWRTQPGSNHQPGWIFRPLLEAYLKLAKHAPSKNKKYFVEFARHGSPACKLEVSLAEAKRIKGLMRKKFFFMRSELYICTIGNGGKGRVKLNMKHFPIFNLIEVNIETNPLNDESHYENPVN